MNKAKSNKHSSYNDKANLEPIVRKNLMNLVAKEYIGNLDEKELNNWLKEASDPLEGMCVGWSWMFIENEHEITKLWHNLKNENPKIEKEDEKLYGALGKKLWYRYINDTSELEEEKRKFEKMPAKKSAEDMILQGIEKKWEDECTKINKIEGKDELYKTLSEKIISIITKEEDSKSRHYIKLDNKNHSMVIAFDAFKNNKGVVTIETACNGIEKIGVDKELLTKILSGAFGGNAALESQFSIETYYRSIESMKSPSVSPLKVSGYSLCASTEMLR